MGDRKRLKNVELNDFRAYKGKMPFDFTTESGEIADFIAIYAPNGAGKTSFFDAIEWGLTGKINRLENDIGDDKYEGYILKNRNSKSKTANVIITLANEKCLTRKTRRLTENQRQDYTRGSKKPSKDEIFKYENWDSLILPHNRIESFVKDNTGAKKYEYWGSYWDPTGEERKEFEFLYKMKKQASTTLESLNLEIEENKLKLDKFKETSEIINNVNKYIKNYNKLVIKREKIRYLNSNFSSKDYSIFVNEIESKKDTLEKRNSKVQNLLKNLSLLNENFMKEFEKDKKGLDYYTFLFDSWSKILSKANDKLNYIDNYNTLSKKISINNEKLECLLEIYNAGKKWFESYNYYKNIKIFINSMLDKRRELDKQIIYFEGQRKNLNNKYDDFILKNNLEEKKIKLDEYEVKINTINVKIKRNKKWFKKFSQLNDQLDKIIKSSKVIKDDAQNSIINNINQFSLIQIATISVNVQNKENTIENLEELIIKKQDIEKNVLAEKGKYDIAEQLSNEMCEVIKTARNYIKTNNSKVCPVCNKEYNSVEELLLKTNITKKDTVMLHFNLWNKYKSELKEIDEEIERVSNEWNKNVKIIIDEKNKNIIKYEKKKKRIKLIIDDLIKKQDKYNDLYKHYIKDINEIGYFDSKISQHLIKIWYEKECDKKKKYLQELTEKIKGIDNEVSKKKEILDNLKEEYEAKSKELNSFESISTNLKFIEFLKDSNLGFNFCKVKDEIDIIKESNSIIKKEQNEISNKIKLLRLIDNSKLTYYKCKVEYFGNVLKKTTQSYSEKYDKFKNITGNGLVNRKVIINKKKKLLKNIQRNNTKLDLIRDIKFSGEIKEYLNFKVKTEKNLSKLYDDRYRCIKKQEKLECIYMAAKKIVEEKITSVLNTPLINDFYRKIEPHPIMKKMKYSLKFNDKDKPELEILVSSDTEEYLPDWYFSSAQLNVVALTTFLARANSVDYSPINTIFIDDPVGHFDDINILAFVDLLRAMIEKNKKQIIISTHDEVVYNLLKRKLSVQYYSTKFIELGYRD
ncbi:hypothetical protein FDF31_03915 [Clostridium sporogenes]|nr:hypothetical protein [Clostridium sporogenes]NFS24816.1 hypothetical protein [Clostridium sporogenes]